MTAGSQGLGETGYAPVLCQLHEAFAGGFPNREEILGSPVESPGWRHDPVRGCRAAARIPQTTIPQRLITAIEEWIRWAECFMEHLQVFHGDLMERSNGGLPLLASSIHRIHYLPIRLTGLEPVKASHPTIDEGI